MTHKPKDELKRIVIYIQKGSMEILGDKETFASLKKAMKQQTAQNIFKDYEEELLEKYQTYEEMSMSPSEIFLKVHKKIKQKYLKER